MDFKFVGKIPDNQDDNILPDNNEDTFKFLEKIVREINKVSYWNQISVRIFTKIIKFQFTNDDEKRHTYIAVDSILDFALHKILNSDISQINTFLLTSNNDMDFEFLKKYVGNNQTYNHFSNRISYNVLNEYYNNKSEIINGKNSFKILKNEFDKQWHITCKSRHTIKFKYDSLIYHFEEFKSYGDNTKVIEFITLKNPQIYTISWYKSLKIWILELENSENLMIVTWPNAYEEGRHQMDLIFELLLVNNIFNSMKYREKIENIKNVTLPLINPANFLRTNIHTALKDMNEFKHLFDKINQEDIIDDDEELNMNFSFRSFSGIEFDESEASHYTDNYNCVDNLIINEPFLYLYLNQYDVLLGGGFFNVPVKEKKRPKLQEEETLPMRR